MPSMLRPALVASLVLLCPAIAPAQVPAKDIPGARDHTMVGRYEGSVIAFQKTRDYDEIRLPKARIASAKDLNDENSFQAKGKAVRSLYRGPLGRSSLEVVRNYEQRLQSQGFETIFTCRTSACGGADLWFAVTEQLKGSGLPSNWENQTYLIARKKDAATDTVVAILSVEQGNEVRSLVDVIDASAMETNKIKVLDASTLRSTLDAQGRAVLYGITFDFNKADIRPESKPQIDQIVAYLKANQAVSAVIAGHTDAKGGFDYNIDLSRKRAQSVIKALTGAGIAANRLTPFGAGMASPVATNETEAGQALNRRVEIVKR